MEPCEVEMIRNILSYLCDEVDRYKKLIEKYDEWACGHYSSSHRLYDYLYDKYNCPETESYFKVAIDKLDELSDELNKKGL
jgi:hypothetical protein